MRTILGIVIAAAILMAAAVFVGRGIDQYGAATMERALGQTFLVALLAVGLGLVLRGIWRNRAQIAQWFGVDGALHPKRVAFALAIPIGFIFGTNNRRAGLSLAMFLTLLSLDMYQFNRVVRAYNERPAVEQAAYSEPVLDRSEIERSVYQFWDGNRVEGTELAKQVPTPSSKPRDLKSTWWFVRLTLTVIVFGLFTLIYWPWSRREEVIAWIKRQAWKLRGKGGGRIEEKQPGMIREWLERRLVSQPPVQATPVIAAAGTVPAAAAVPKPSFFSKLEKWFHPILTGILLLDEVFEKRPEKAR